MKRLYFPVEASHDAVEEGKKILKDLIAHKVLAWLKPGPERYIMEVEIFHDDCSMTEVTYLLDSKWSEEKFLQHIDL